MITVIFEVQPAPGALTGYLDIAASLRPELETIDGYGMNDRAQSPQDSRAAHGA